MYNSTKKRNVIKHLYAMTRFTFLVIATIITLSGVCIAGDVKSQGLDQVKVTLSLKKTNLDQILDQLERQSGFSFTYPQEVGKLGPFSIDVKNQVLLVALQQLASGNRLVFKPKGRLIAVSQLPARPQPGRISGKVADHNGEPLPGASVKIIETGQIVQSAVDGSYSITLPPGTYTMEFSYISFQTQRVTGVVVTESKNTALNISLKAQSNGLKEVVVTSGYKKASTEGLLARQKNASEISNGISAEQIARTPDKNIGESLKRISGVSTIDNKFVIVRGIGERYNSAMLDGVVLPSSEAQTRNFSFDLIPSNMVDNVVVSKTVTPDMNVSFGGGLVQINTKDVPNENFMSFTAGASYNDQSTGKDFLSHKRGKYDFLGFDDGNRKFPTDLQHTDRTTVPNNTLTNEEYQKKIDDQSKRFTNDNFTLYKNKTAPSQNYQFVIGRVFTLDTTKDHKLGFTGSVSFRNTQAINEFEQQRRSDWNYNSNNQGATYTYNSTIGALLNIGLQLGKNRFSLRNTYTHMYDNALVRTIGYDNENGTDDLAKGLPPNRIQEYDDPTFINLLQHKLNGQHQLGKAKIEWNLAKTSIDRKEKDLSIATSSPRLVGGEYQYFYYTSQETEPRINPTSRHNYHNSEGHYSWNIDGTLPFSLLGMRNSVKTGYFGASRKATFDWQIAALVVSRNRDESMLYLPISEMINPVNFGANGYNYSITPYFLDAYEGKSKTHAAYLMLDNKLMEKLRLVWGIRTEYYKYTEIKNGMNIRGSSEFRLPAEKNWRWLPSANLTYTPINALNIRVAASSSIVRPELMDNSQFFKYNPNLGALFGNQGLSSTKIDSYDFKTEWFPGLGELISAGVFYKKFDRPTELSFILVNGNINYYLRNASKAKVYGLEFELRKNFGFIAKNKILENLTAYGNLTLQRSSVVATYRMKNPDPKLSDDIDVEVKQKRSMYGQSPYLINAGLQYSGPRLGMNVSYNKAGYKTYLVSSFLNQIEYEMPRSQIDAQLSYKFIKNRLELKLNVSNLLNKASTFFINDASYEKDPNGVVNGDPTDDVRLKEGFSNKYEPGDQLRYRQHFGRTYSTSLTYNF